MSDLPQSTGENPMVILDLEPEDPSQVKAFGTTIWETSRGKRNRLAIGQPRCLRERTPSDGGLLKAGDTAVYPSEAHEFYRIELSVTLLPDEGCRFRAADIFLELEQPDSSELPLILRLVPEEVTTQKVVTSTTQQEASLTTSDPVVKVLKGSLGDSHSREEKVEEMEVQLGSFGSQTPEGGWRFQLTAARPIAFSFNALSALIVIPKGRQAVVHFKIVASIEIQSVLDQWLTVLFTNRDRPSASLSYTFPKISS